MELKSKILLSVNFLFLILLFFSLYTNFYITDKLFSDRLEKNLIHTHNTINSVVNSKRSQIEADSINQNCRNNKLLECRYKKNHKWNSYFEKNLINSFNYFIRIYDKNSKKIWYTNNIIRDEFDIKAPNSANDFSVISDSLSKLKNAPEGIAWNNFEGNLERKINKKILLKDINDKKYKLLISEDSNYIITVGQPLDFYFNHKNKLFISFFITILISLILSFILGNFIIKKPFSYLSGLTDSISKIEIGKEISRIDDNYNYKEINEIASAINHTLDEAFEHQQRLSRFSAEVAHELKTPLTILRGELSLALQGEKSSEELLITVASALDEATRLTGVVDALLDLARAETGQVKLFKENTNLSELIKSLAEDAEILGEEKSILIKSDIEDNIIFSFDNSRIHQAILNIIDNSIKYTQEKGIITIDLKQDGNYAVITIGDTGIGISEEDQKRIFESFYRADEVKMKRLNGLGLGLTMVKWIINAHNGTIRVKSSLGEGSIFSIILPMSK